MEFVQSADCNTTTFPQGHATRILHTQSPNVHGLRSDTAEKVCFLMTGHSQLYQCFNSKGSIHNHLLQFKTLRQRTCCYHVLRSPESCVKGSLLKEVFCLRTRTKYRYLFPLGATEKQTTTCEHNGEPI